MLGNGQCKSIVKVHPKMSNETLQYLAGFNTNPICLGFGPTDVPVDPYKTVSLVIYVLAAAFMVVTSMWYMYIRRYRRRLRIRPLNPIIVGSIGSSCIILVRAYYNYVGREYMLCSVNVSFAYIFLIFNLIPDNLLVTSFLVQQKLRDHIATTNLVPHQQAAAQKVEPDTKKVSDYAPKIEVQSVITGGMSGGDTSSFFNDKIATPVQWLKGFWNYFLTLEDVLIFSTGSANVAFHSKWRFAEETRVSGIRQMSYDIVLTVLFSGSLSFGMGMRVALFPPFNPINGCTGCAMEGEEIGVLMASVLFLAFMQSVVLRKTRSVSDPLGYRQDMLWQCGIASLCWVSYTLAATDPGRLMKNQKIDWFFIESLAAFLLHCHRCVLQLWRVSRIHKKAEQNIRLIDVLQDPKAAIMFEKYLMGELASENLLFWREGIKYKVNFDKNHDFDYSQQVAKMLLRTFISKHAQLPINISGPLRDTIEARFKGGFVGKNVFDEALADLYKMMQNGPFYRFVRSKAFQEYSRKGADFSMMVLTTPADVAQSNSVLAQFTRNESFADTESMRSAGGPSAPMDVAFDVNVYIKSL